MCFVNVLGPSNRRRKPPKITLEPNRFRSDLPKVFLTSEIIPFPTLVSPMIERGTYEAEINRTSAEKTCGLNLQLSQFSMSSAAPYGVSKTLQDLP